jgi:tetratricopeptide (TPR) repeat protein
MAEPPLPLPARVSVALARSLEWVWPGGAAWAYGDALRWAPEEPEIFFRQGAAFSRARRFDAAARSFAGAASLQPRHLEYQASLAAALHLAGRREELVSALRRLIELRPGEGELSVLLGAILLRHGNRVEALRAFRRAATLSPGHERRRFVLGEILLGPDGWSQALASWQGAVRIDSRGADRDRVLGGRSVLHRHPGRSLSRTVGRMETSPSLLRDLRGRWDRLGGLLRRALVQRVTGDEREQRVRALRRAWRKASPARSGWPAILVSRRRRSPDASA